MSIKFKRNLNYAGVAVLLLWVFALLVGVSFLMSLGIFSMIIFFSFMRDYDCHITDKYILVSKPFNPFYNNQKLEWKDIEKIEFYKADIAIKGPMVNNYFNFYLSREPKKSEIIRAEGVFKEKDLTELKAFCKLNEVPFTVI